MQVWGNGELGILIWAEVPTESGMQTLRQELKNLGIDMDRDCWRINSVDCVPSERTPSSLEIACCRSRKFKLIEEFKPKLIILLGGVAVESFLKHRWLKDFDGINKWRGWQIPDQQVGAWICPIFHPTYVAQSDKQPVVLTVWRRDLERALRCAKRPFPTYALVDNVKVYKEPAHANMILSTWLEDKPEFVVVDYEATGLKPQRAGHMIACVGLAASADTAISFPVTDEILPLLKKLLRDPLIKKVAHNHKYEELWTRELIHKEGIRAWHWDTMLAAHILDERPKIIGLKFQTYVNFGIVDYDSHIKPYLQSNGDSANDKNRLEKIWESDPDGVMEYCASDALNTYRLMLKQKPLIEATGSLSEAMELFMDGSAVFSDMEHSGIRIDLDYCKKMQAHLSRQVNRLESQFESSELALLWKKNFGNKTNYGSNAQLSKVLFSELGHTSTKMTGSGAASVDKDVLAELEKDEPELGRILEIKKLKKMRDADLAGLIAEADNGRGTLHPFFHLGCARSMRSSSTDPNFQNFPVRDKLANKIVRSAICPSPGNQIIEVDYRGIEVRVSACIHHDPNMIAYIEDPSTDMHRDTGMDIWCLSADEMTKETRYYAKNGFVFPQFYGDWWKSCAESLWKTSASLTTQSGVPIREHLREHGIKGLGTLDKNMKPSANSFYSHVRDAENVLWFERFKVYSEWKNSHMREYERKGYFDIVTGFRFGGVMGKNKVLNRPIQGPAFHCLLKSAFQLKKIRESEQWLSKIVGQIHDSIIFNARPEETDHILKTTRQVMCEWLREVWPWIIVPLEIEAEVTLVDKPWYYKEKVKL